MEFEKVSLTEPYDIAIILKYVEKKSDELKYRILNLMKILLFQKLIFTDATGRVS